MKKINLTSFALLAYLIIMSVLGWPGRAKTPLSYTEYFCMIGATVVIILLLRFLQIKRMKMRNKRNEKEEL
ncbi:hypothetical protein D0T51_10310 [Parabacteroides sp. 52]|uniref:hypothetical protein n=1 Tax=unclassified Parabacteroides TaxID=2649774 RepID=UPI0013D72DB5|nr:MULTISPECIES: hypothetical protein [unclassified Parabacteroides]MDH6534651.1 Na+/melibiose symporter-like transporter [Parabacteroides sp. PM5-20]NDV56118.1 hypothetical protein [Parabacteroides sp. 52]